LQENIDKGKMALNIQQLCDWDSDQYCIVHSMPCKINHNGQANVTGFFTPYIENKELNGCSGGNSIFCDIGKTSVIFF
jgi:hypothetical protein